MSMRRSTPISAYALNILVPFGRPRPARHHAQGRGFVLWLPPRPTVEKGALAGAAPCSRPKVRITDFEAGVFTVCSRDELPCTAMSLVFRPTKDDGAAPHIAGRHPPRTQ